ncbi:quinol monooxygenase YgiN [Mumia flava]|uniref:Quinol monooxygenase YgiN n=1 Tax=Mumia flava TaxID=1348852 RepID=A0A2M9BGU8_9ACTN|nr:putative quinol monooxygenase [Mumia flava]PJJ57177.1 quinol monooxygenase YgiN [Mumia flava]
MTLNVVALLTTKPGSGPALEQAIAEVRSAMLAHDGCLRYDLQRRRKSETEYVMIEAYETTDALRAHGSSDEFVALSAALGELLAAPPEVIVLDPVGDQTA